MKKNFLGILCLIFLSVVLNAQTTQLNGIVIDENNLPLPGVSIIQWNTNNGTTTKTDGSFEFNLLDNNAKFIEVSFLGYKTEKIKIESQDFLSVKMIPESLSLGEVVVTALGLERETQSLGYHVQLLDARQVSEVKSANFIDNLGGKLAGVTVNQGATGVGSTTKISIRGESSFTNNNPLIVIDGTPINNNTILNFTNEAAAGFQEVDFGNGGMEINADEIENMSILKGPAAAALYGTRASSGVLLVTTKSGNNTQGINVSVNSSLFIDRAFKLPKFQNKYGQGNSGAFEFVDGLGAGTNDNITYSWGPELDTGNSISQFDSPVTLPDGRVVRGGDIAVHGGQEIPASPFVSHPDNLSRFYETGITHINSLAISSGNDKGHYRFSFSNLDSKSIIPGTNLKRKNLSLNSTFNINEKLTFRTRLNYVNSSSDNRPSNGYGSENVNYSLVAWGPRSLDTRILQDYWQPGLEGLQQYSFNYTFFDNPYFILLENRNAFTRDRLFGNAVLQYDITSELSIMARTGMDYSNEDRTFRRAFSTNRFRNGAFAQHDVFFREVNTDFLLNYKKTFNKFSVDASVGGNQMNQKASTNQSQTLSLAQPGIYKLSNAASPIEVFQFESQKIINSVYGVVKLGWSDMLFLDLTARNDWSSALASPTSSDNISFFYPSASLSYILSKGLKMPDFVSFAQLRMSWAQVGNDTNPYQTSGTFLAQTPYLSQPTFSASNVIANNNLNPEQTTSIEFGADLRFFDDRLSLDFSYYNALTKNQIISLPVSITSGFDTQVVNGGQVRSTGIELVATVVPVYKQNLKWDLQLNFSQNKTVVEKLPDGVDRLTLAYSRVYDNTNQTVWFQVDEGGEIGDIYGTGYLRNENDDFVVDANGNFIADNELKKLGNANPDFILGINNSIQYKNFNFSVVGELRYGGQIVSRTLSLAGVGGQLLETVDRPESGIVIDGVVNTGTEASPEWVSNTQPISAERYYRQFYDRNHEENNIYNATYFKLRELAIGYTFETNKMQGLFQHISDLNISLIGRNLFVFSEIPHFDPEQLAVQGNQFVRGVEDMSYATTRSIGIKLGLNF